jgi:HEAT repeat protein
MRLLLLATLTVSTHLHAQSIAQLSDPNPVTREWAARGLGAADNRRAVPALIKALDDTNVHVRQAAATALGELGDARGIQPLIAALHNQSAETCSLSSQGQIIDALSLIGWPAVPPLLDALRDPNEGTANSAGKALGGIHDRRLNDLLLGMAQSDPDPHVKEHALEALAEIKDPATVPILIAILNQRPAAPTTPRSGKNDTAYYRDLNDPSTGPRTRAEFALDQIATPEATAALTAARSSTNEFVRDNAKRLVAQHTTMAGAGDSVAKPIAGRMANNPPRPVPTGPANPSDLAGLRSSNEDDRWRAADNLGKSGDPAAIDPLVQALRTERQSSVRMHIVRALIAFPDARAMDPIVAFVQHTDSRDDLFWTPRNLGEGNNPLAMPALVKLLQDPRATVREAGATGLAEGQAPLDPITTAALVAALKDPNAEVRGEAARALIHVADRSTVPALIEALQDTDWSVRVSAAYALAHTGDARAIPALLGLFASEEPGQTNSAAAALGQMTDPAALSAIVGALSSPNPHVRLIAAQVLRYRNDPKTYPALIRSEGDTDADVRRAATLALSGCPLPMVAD